MADPVIKTDKTMTSPSTPGQKRKRSAEQGSPDSRRSKRGAPAAAMSAGESVPNTFMDSADMASAAAAASVNVADFNALQAVAHGDHDQPEAADPANASSTAAAALDYPNIHIPQTTEETFAPPPGLDEQHHGDTSFSAPDLGHTPDGLLPGHAPPPTATAVPTSVPVVAPSSVPAPMPTMNPVPAVPSPSTVIPQVQNGYAHSTPPQGALRPAVGSEEWHKIRKDNHKEVERRRRETINEGINELSKIVPGCEKNKGSILQRAVAFITQLKENEAQNIEKWTLEKLLTEQAIAELSASNDKLKQECDRLYREVETWKRLCQDNGITGPKEEPVATTGASTTPATTAPATSSS